MTEEGENEYRIRDVMAAGIGAEPPVTDGPARVFAEVHRVRARRRSVAGALSVVAVLGVGAGAVAVTNSGGPGPGKGPAGPGALATTTAARASATSTTSAAAATSSTSAIGKATSPSRQPIVYTVPTCAPVSQAQHAAPQGKTVPMDARSSLELLKELIPSQFKTTHYAGQDGGGGSYATMAIDDGHGLAGIGVNAGQSGITDEGTECPALPDGSRLFIGSLDDDKPVTGPYGSLGEYVRRIWPDGTSIAIQVFNYWPDEFVQHPYGWKATGTRPTPALNSAQLLAVAADSRWRPTVTAAFAAQAKRDLVPYLDGSN